MSIRNKYIKTFIISIISIFILSSVAFAVSSTVNSNKEEVPDNATKIDDEVSVEKNLKFRKTVEWAKKKELKAQNFYKFMEEYSVFVKVYKPSQQELEYITGLVEQGCELDRLIDIYRFWLDTDEDMALIKKIYDEYKLEYEQDSYWVESVFNKLTGSEYGVLNKEQIQEYFKKGLTRDDIVAANRLCRMGKYTIAEILEKKLSGSSWVEITEEVYSLSAKRDMLKIDKSKKGKYKSIRTGEYVLDSIFLSRRTGEDINVYLDKLSSGGDITGEMSAYINNSTKGVLESLKAQGLWDEPRDVKERNEKARKDLIEKIKGKGMPEKKIEEFKAKGYSELDILNACELSKKHKTSAERLLKEKSKGRSWQDIAEKGVR